MIALTDTPALTYSSVLKFASLYFHNDDLAASTWINKYCLKDYEGRFLEHSPDDMHRRMASEFHRIEQDFSASTDQEFLSPYGKIRTELDEETIYKFFKDFKYLIPQGSVMALLGNPFAIGSLSNCVVIKSPLDSYGGIFYTDQQIAQLCKRRCGVGFDISTLRPKGLVVKNAAGTSSGVTSFMERFSNTTREVSQNGRRGALMLTMDVRHPDIEDFIKVKNDLKKVTGANLSVKLTDDFMEAVRNGGTYHQIWPLDNEEPKISREVDAGKIWKDIIVSTHASAEPGVIFWDRQHYYSTSSIYPDFKNESTNPCSEIAMQGGDSCRLMAINLFSFVNHPFTSEAVFDFDLLYKITYESQRLMDDLVSLEIEAIDRIIQKIEEDPEPVAIKQVELETWKLLRTNGLKGRRTGLGFTALADALAALNVPYSSDEGLEIIEQIMKKKCEAEFDSSIDMAITRGKFEAYDADVESQSEFVRFFEETCPDTYSRMRVHGRRNISISTVAPTGSVSLMAQTSSGIEPVFMTSYTRRRKLDTSTDGKADFVDDLGDRWEEFEVFHPKLKQWMDMYPDKDFSKNPYQGSTAMEIDWERRIQIQSIIQKYVTHSISSTINLPENTSTDIVNKIYLEAWNKGLKGITIYRDGSRSGVLVSKEDREKVTDLIDHSAPKRPEELTASIVRFQNDHEQWLAFVGLLADRPYEIFTGRAEDAFALPVYVDGGWIIKSRDTEGNSRYDFRYVDKQGFHVTIEGLSRSFNKEYWNYAKLISGIIRHGMPLIDLIHLIDHLHLHNESINTWKNGVTRALKQFIPNGTQSKNRQCQTCGDDEGLIYEEGCLHCKSCGSTTCS